MNLHAGTGEEVLKKGKEEEEIKRESLLLLRGDFLPLLLRTSKQGACNFNPPFFSRRRPASFSRKKSKEEKNAPSPKKNSGRTTKKGGHFYFFSITSLPSSPIEFVIRLQTSSSPASEKTPPDAPNATSLQINNQFAVVKVFF